ncbi:MAG: hypothetical protein KBG12_05815 [Syntrophobacterales bacterium]|nr:hypothetical protein [Syntrophobacterales bacterium]
MLIKSFQEAEEMARKAGPKKMSVLRAENKEFLLALKEAYERGYGEPVLIGEERKIREIAGEIGFDISNFAVIDSRDPQEVADCGVRLAATGETDFVLRGYIYGPPFYSALIKSTSDREGKRQISAVCLLEFAVLPKFIAITDPGLAVAPDFAAKMEIIKNAVNLLSRLGYESPQVGIIAAQRGLNDDLVSVSDANRIREAFEQGELPGCSLAEGLTISDFLLGEDGFLESFDRVDYSRMPDILLVHNLEFGNIFVKVDSLAERDFFSGVRRHSFIVGAGIPIVAPSRSDTHETIITEIALGVLIS